jgi:DNA polymerase I-like protein with 3'-5' exonuclease and polymerase domains
MITPSIYGAARAAVNTLVQGSAADIVMAAMVAMEEDGKLVGLGWRLLL